MKHGSYWQICKTTYVASCGVTAVWRLKVWNWKKYVRMDLWPYMTCFFFTILLGSWVALWVINRNKNVQINKKVLHLDLLHFVRVACVWFMFIISTFHFLSNIRGEMMNCRSSHSIACFYCLNDDEINSKKCISNCSRSTRRKRSAPVCPSPVPVSSCRALRTGPVTEETTSACATMPCLLRPPYLPAPLPPLHRPDVRRACAPRWPCRAPSNVWHRSTTASASLMATPPCSCPTTSPWASPRSLSMYIFTQRPLLRWQEAPVLTSVQCPRPLQWLPRSSVLH